MIAGVAGVGKTRLAREAERLAPGHGLVVARIVASRSSTALPLGPFARWRAGGQSDGAAPVRSALLASAGTHRLMLVVDDAHLLDDPSAALVHDLRATDDVVVVATVRSREPEPGGVLALWKDEWCERIELQPLGAVDVLALLAAVLDGSVDGATAHHLWQISRGNVLHLREIVLAGVGSGALAQRGGLWTWSGVLEAPRLLELVADRLAHLGGAERRVLECLSLGEPLPWPALAALAGAADLEALLRAELIEAVTDPRTGTVDARLGHPVVGDALAAGLAPPVRARLLGELATALAGSGAAATTDEVRLASWRLDAGAAVDVPSLLSASARCRFVDAELGARFARAAMERGGGAEAAVALAQHLVFSHHGEEAAELLAAVEVEGTPPGEGDGAVALAVERANLLTWGLGQPDAAVASLDRAGGSLRTDPAGARELRAHTVPMLLYAGRVPEALERAECIRNDPDSSPSQRVRSILGEIPALVAAGRPAGALQASAEALPLLPQCGPELPLALGQLGAVHTLAQMLCGELEPAAALIRSAYESGVANDVPLQRGGAALRLGQIALWQGAVRAAAHYLREAVGALESADAGFLGWAADGLELASALAGDVAAARAAAAVATSALRFGIYVSERARSEAATAAAAGEHTRARQRLAEGIEQAAAVGHHIQVVVLAFDLARLGDPIAAQRAVERLGVLDGALAPALVAGVRALAGSDGGERERVGEELARLGVALHAAELLAAASSAHRAHGSLAAASRCAARASALAAACEGATTPLLRAGAPGAALTRREREVAELASRDLADAEIAERLGMSVRTVETHLHRAYGKLGIGGRSELALVLGVG